MKTIISVDFDSTLSRPDVQKYIKELIVRGIDVYIVTSRYDELHKHKYPANPSNEDLYKVAYSLGLPKHKIRFTCMRNKSEYLQGTNVLWHLDDDWIELNHINKDTNTIGISCIGGSWKQKCENILKSHEALVEERIEHFGI